MELVNKHLNYTPVHLYLTGSTIKLAWQQYITGGDFAGVWTIVY